MITSKNVGVIDLLLQKAKDHTPGIIVTIAYIIILFVQSIRLNTILNNSKMYSQVGFMPAFAYIFLSGLLPNAYSLSSAFIANSFILLSISLMLKLYNNSQAKTLIFNLGLLVAAAAICYYPNIILIFIAFCGIAVLRPFKAAEWFIFILGVLTPFYLLFSILYLINFDFHKIVLYKLQFFIHFKKGDVWYIVNLSAIAVLMLIAFINWYPNSNRLVIQIRKNWVIFLILFIASLVAIPFYTKMNALPEIIFLVPAAAFLANAFVYSKRLFWLNIFLILCGTIIFYHNYNIWK